MTRKIKIEPITISKEQTLPNDPIPKPKRGSRKKTIEPVELMPEVVKTVEPEISPSLSDEETYKTFVQQVELKPVELKPVIEEPVVEPVIEPVMKTKKEGEKATCPICNKTMLLKTLKYYHSLKCKPTTTTPPPAPAPQSPPATIPTVPSQPAPMPDSPPKTRLNPALERATQRKERLNSLIMNSLKR